MKLKTEKDNLIRLFLYWFFVFIPKKIFNRFNNLFRFGIYFFSMDKIPKTFLNPWKKLSDSYNGPFDIKKYFEAFFGNIISRIIGMFLRTFLILFFIIFEIFIIFLGIIVLIGWFLIIPLTIFIFYFYAISF